MNAKNIIKKTRFIFVFAMLLALPQIGETQAAPFTINNNTGCKVTVHWQVQDPINCWGCDWATVTIPAFTPYVIPSFGGSCASPVLGCELIISIIQIGATPVFFQFSSFITTPVPYGPPVAGCATAGAFTLYSPVGTPNTFDINP